MKKSKKFVLAWLVLLAITGLLALAGCKNDSVPETPAAKLVSISVTPSEGTVYSVGEKVVHKKGDEIGVIATYDDGTTSTVTGTITTDTSSLTESAGIGKTVTVSYKEGDTTKEATFTIDVASYEFTETVQDVDSSYAGTMTDGTYKKFGDWPQTIKDKDVTVGKNTMTRGGMDFHVGSDGNYYVKAEEKAYEAGYKYSDDSEVKQKDESSSPSTRWFKVEPIVWRVLTTSYKAPEGGTVGEILLLAESILTGGIPYYHFDWEEGGLGGVEWSGPRIIGNKTIHPNNYEHSQIRAWLNGLSYQSKESEGATQSSKDEYKNAGFLQTAFTESAQKLIADTTVDNSAASTTDAGSNLFQATDYACANTTDKIFLLSEQEATNSEYGFGAYKNEDSTRIRFPTDYAKATGAGAPSADYGGWWWLRSPGYDRELLARVISINGYDVSYGVIITNMGVVPALSISLQ